MLKNWLSDDFKFFVGFPLCCILFLLILACVILSPFIFLDAEARKDQYTKTIEELRQGKKYVVYDTEDLGSKNLADFIIIAEQEGYIIANQKNYKQDSTTYTMAGKVMIPITNTDNNTIYIFVKVK